MDSASKLNRHDSHSNKCKNLPFAYPKWDLRSRPFSSVSHAFVIGSWVKKYETTLGFQPSNNLRASNDS